MAKRYSKAGKLLCYIWQNDSDSSSLHKNLIEHLNAEIGLGIVKNKQSALKWLRGTFMCVRLKANPDHYRIEGDAPSRNLDERLERICSRNIDLLREHSLVAGSDQVSTTEFGDAMARYYVEFETMKILLGLPPRAKISEMASPKQQRQFGQLIADSCLRSRKLMNFENYESGLVKSKVTNKSMLPPQFVSLSMSISLCPHTKCP